MPLAYQELNTIYIDFDSLTKHN